MLVFFLTPLAEMYLLIELGGIIGTWPTIGLVVLTAVVGVALLRIQGLNTLTRGMGRVQQGEMPGREIAEGLLLAVAGALLVTPGFVTDVIGFTLLAPWSRQAIAGYALSKVNVVSVTCQPGFADPRHHEGKKGNTIDGEFERRHADEKG